VDYYFIGYIQRNSIKYPLTLLFNPVIDGDVLFCPGAVLFPAQTGLRMLRP
jgi:hypothetical protein